VLRHPLAWLRRGRHRRQLQKALQAQPLADDPTLVPQLQALASQQFDRWRGGRMPSRAACEAGLQRLHDDHPGIHVFDIDGTRVLARRKTGRAARHPVDAIDARLFAKRVNHYGTLLAEVLRQPGHRPASGRLSLAIDLRDIPYDDAELPVFAFQRRVGGGNPLLPDVDFFHHGWYLDDHDPLAYGEKSIGASFAGASTGRPLLRADDVRQHASERLRLAQAFLHSHRVRFRIASAVHCDSEATAALLRAQPYFAEPIPWAEQLACRFLISVDGNGATCSRVVKALRSHSVLLKFASDYELYYFALLEPGRHYLPVKEATDVERVLDAEEALHGRHAALPPAANAWAMRVLGAGAVLAYTGQLLDAYRALYPSD
jgi:hypothetical protein